MNTIQKVLKNIASKCGLGVYERDKLSEKYDKWGNVKKAMLEVETCIDVGVGRGTNSMYESVNFESLVLIEPLRMYKTWIDRIKSKNNAVWVKKGASSEKGEKKINVNKDKPEKSSFLKRQSSYRRSGEKEKVK